MQQATNPAAETARDQDVYAVYSVLMSNPPVVGGASNATYAIASMTVPATLESASDSSLPNAFKILMAQCEAPPPGYEDRWQEILSDSRSRGDAPVPLLRELKIAKPYVYLSSDEVAVFKFSRGSINAPLGSNPQFGGAVAVISLSNVFFNKDRTLAVVRISSSCGPLCGHGERKIYEKSSTGWKEVTTGPRCSVDA